MKTIRVFTIRIIVLTQVLTAQAYAGETARHEGLVVGFQSGYGHLQLHSDQAGDATSGTFSLGFQGGYSVTPRAIVGMEVGGWLLEPYSFDAHGDEEERGESVSNTMLFLHAFPVKRLPVYMRFAVGYTYYKNNHPDKHNGSGWGSWLIGGGYEIRASDRFFIAPQVSYGHGDISDVPRILWLETGRRYDVIDFSVAVHWYSGVIK